MLIVEDDPIIAIDFEDRLLGFGVKSVRTVGSVAQALAAIAARAPDFALLDVELSRENSFAVAERLAAMQIPFVFVTGYGAEARIVSELRRDRGCKSRARAKRWRQRCARGGPDVYLTGTDAELSEIVLDAVE